MPLSINTNISSLQSDRQLNKSSNAVKNSFERLSSGKRINKPSIDPAGLAVAVELLGSAGNNAVAARNISDGVSVASIADGAIQTASQITGRLGELATQAANGTLTDSQRGQLNNEFQALTAELDRISGTTEFNGQQLLSGDSQTTLQVGEGSDASSQITLSLPGVSSSSLGLTGDISTQAGAQAAIEQATAASETLAGARGEIGATVSRLDSAFQNVQTIEVNQRQAASRIVDADVAKETADLTANSIRQQVGAAIKAQANTQPALALQLLS